ncbi:Permease YjgP/YjgQ [hydrothermal vent metagenome]|uniref:Permease YjgP/YjgQ n=1 Tax=hydrothermal vent metagenome TaxID=652676 RepID=A0A1W1EEK5_9ZZZZ
MAWRYIKNLFAILFGLSAAFAIIDYFQHIEQLNISSNYQILYIFYMWQEALGLLYPLAIVFAVIMTKIGMVKSNNMGALHAFGYNKKRLFFPIFVVISLVYAAFFYLQTTEFSYAKDKAKVLLENQINAYDVNDVFFKYNDTFVYIEKLDPIKKIINNITIFKVKDDEVLYTMKAPYAIYGENLWEAKNAVVKQHVYKDGKLLKYNIEHKESIITLRGYKPKIITSLYEGKALNIIDAYATWQLFEKQNINSDKVRAVIYNKVIVPLFAIALALILFFKLPFHARMMSLGLVIASSLGATFVIWGVLFGLNQMGENGVLKPEITAILPIIILWIYAIYVYFTDEKYIR